MSIYLTREQVEKLIPLARLEAMMVYLDANRSALSAYTALAVMIDQDAALRAELERTENGWAKTTESCYELRAQNERLTKLTETCRWCGRKEGHTSGCYEVMLNKLKQQLAAMTNKLEQSQYQTECVESDLVKVQQQLAAMRQPDGYLHGWPRNEGTVLIGVGVHCAGCGKSFGITNVGFSDDYVAPTEKPSWPWPEADCPMCHAEERWRKKMAVDPLAERLKAKLKEEAR